MNIQSLIRPHLQSAKAYSSARDEYKGKDGVFLDANENPHGSLAGDGWNRYPDPYQREVKDRVSEIKGVPVANIFLGNGSDEPIDLLIQAFCEPGIDEILITPPTYGMYEVSASIKNVTCRKVLLNEDFSLNIESLLDQLTSTSKIVFLCSPNNPTGNTMKREDLLKVVQSAPGLVVIDEAYIDFSNDATLVNELPSFSNLVILQTFSKAWGMASLRLGMAFANVEVINILNKIKAPYNISGPIQQMALEALEKGGSRERWVSTILEERKRLTEVLEGNKYVRKVYPSETNFLLVKFIDSDLLFQFLMSEKIIVRDRSHQPLCEEALRLTVGTVEENDHMLHAIDRFYYSLNAPK